MNLTQSPVTPDLTRALERVKAKTGERWSAPFVLDRIRNGQALALKFTQDGEHIAWMVVEILDGYERVLNIWILEGSPGRGRRDEFVARIDDLARVCGAKLWKLESPRKGWSRALRGVITHERTVYERVLS